jgi:hypothetical protein
MRTLLTALGILWLVIATSLSAPFLCIVAACTPENKRDELAVKYRRLMNRILFHT